MNEPSDTLSHVTPSATPSEDDVAAWQALPREEQLRRLRAALGRADCAEASPATMSDILRRAQAAATTRLG